ncbi:hypothetical protein [uncultured Ruminococcus sp.]|uniref:hypothetical protein n=1 Tax=uncultured Ruminococcus sp. TaxID=165186 RepID=UPI002930316A|nr:hypothetical protein [uncultured Ruminococcus sp.]
MDCGDLHITLSNEQAKDIARAIYGDIADYIQAHKQEYSVFLKDEYPILQRDSGFNKNSKSKSAFAELDTELEMVPMIE